MFTGLVASVGILERREKTSEGFAIVVRGLEGEQLERGESVAVNGVCLTVLPGEQDRFTAILSFETVERTTLAGLAPGSPVNLERALRAGDRLGGHFVQGHVDCVGTLLSVEEKDGGTLFRWSMPSTYRGLVAPKGSIAVDGISLTIVDPHDDSFGAAIIPETMERTNLSSARPGDRVNLEFDMIARHVQRIVETHFERT